MSKTFIVTIGDSGTSEEYMKNLNSERLRHIIWNVSNLKMCEINVEESVVEQSCGTPDFTEKSTALLVGAKRRLGDCASYEDGRDNDDLIREINEFLMEKNRLDSRG